MREPLAAITSDWHLDRGAWKARDLAGVRGDSYESLRQITRHLVDHDVPFHLAAGDLFDTPSPCTTDLYEAVGSHRKAGKKTFFVQGQHEMVDPEAGPPWLAFCADAVHLHDRQATIGRGTQSLSVRGLDFRPPHLLRPLLDRLPPCDILLTHQTWRQFVSKGGSSCSLAEVSGVGLLATGDYHRHLDLMTTNTLGQPMRVLSPGSTCLQALDEPPEKAFFVLYDDWTVQSVPLVTRQLYRFQLTTEEELEALLSHLSWERLRDESAHLPEVLRVPIVEVQYLATLPGAYERLLARLGGVHHVLKAVAAEDAAPGLPRQPSQEVVEECLASIVDSSTELYAHELSLLGSRQPTQTLRQIEREFRERHRARSAGGPA